MVLSDVRVLKISAVGEGGWKRGGAEEREVGENERLGRRGGVLGDAGSRNPGRRPRVPALFLTEKNPTVTKSYICD